MIRKNYDSEKVTLVCCTDFFRGILIVCNMLVIVSNFKLYWDKFGQTQRCNSSEGIHIFCKKDLYFFVEKDMYSIEY